VFASKEGVEKGSEFLAGILFAGELVLEAAFAAGREDVAVIGTVTQEQHGSDER
jgi:hypothetical protein